MQTESKSHYMKFEVVLSPALYDGRLLKEDHTTIAVDVLRATSAICAAFKSGASEIVPLDSLEKLRDYDSLGYTLAAERGGEKVHGAKCGNSPTEYLSMDLTGSRLAYSTTNGTVSILRAAESTRLYVGAFANLSALAQRLVDECNDTVVLCSGWKGDPSLEDTLFAGALAERIQDVNQKVELVNDAAMIAMDLWQSAKGDLYGYCRKATHVHRLMRLGYERDIRWAFEADTCPLVPVYKNGRLIVES